MAYAIQSELKALTELCERYRVRKLALFGSALRDDFDAARSDLDFVVEFKTLPSGEHAISYFGFLRELERLFGRKIDLGEAGTIRNPYLLRTVEAEQRTLYAA